MKFKELVYNKCQMNFNQLSVKSGIPVTTICSISKRNSIMNTNLGIVSKIAGALGMSIDELVTILNGEN